MCDYGQGNDGFLACTDQTALNCNPSCSQCGQGGSWDCIEDGTCCYTVEECSQNDGGTNPDDYVDCCDGNPLYYPFQGCTDPEALNCGYTNKEALGYENHECGYSQKWCSQCNYKYMDPDTLTEMGYPQIWQDYHYEKSVVTCVNHYNTSTGQPIAKSSDATWDWVNCKYAI